jgi:hypothetical protein
MWIEAGPEQAVPEAWVYLTPDEARDLLEALAYRSEDDAPDPGWHTHITDSGRELTIAINAANARGRFSNR